MKKILFASDLDNTLIFSYKHRQGDDRCLEVLDGAEQCFCTRRGLELLARLCRRASFVPVTTRSQAQYRRIAWPEGCAPAWAVVANGGVLLAGDEPDPAWAAATAGLVAPWREQLGELAAFVEAFPIPKRCRLVDDTYYFAACDDRAGAEALGAACAGRTALEIAVSGRKVYFLPPAINKGAALERLQARLEPELTICAGDSPLDAPMLRLADLAIIPAAELLPEGCRGETVCWRQEGRFVDFALAAVLARLGIKATDSCLP